METLNEFVSNSTAEKAKDGSWNVYINGIYKISYCTGKVEFEAKEWAYNYIKKLKIKSDEENSV